MSVFGTVLTIIVSFLHTIVFVRIGYLPLRKRWIPINVWIGVGIGLWLVFVLCRSLDLDGGIGRITDFVAHHWAASVFIIAVWIMVSEAIAGIAALTKQPYRSHIRTGGAAIGIFFVAVAHIQGLRSPVITDIEISVKGLAVSLDGATIVAVSDMHIGEPTLDVGWLTDCVETIQSLNPDVVVLVGDLFERNCAGRTDFSPILLRLTPRWGVWAVRGNHDMVRAGRNDAVGPILADGGVRLLTNEWAVATEGLVIVGVDDLTSLRRRSGEDVIAVQRAFAGQPEGTTVYLSHSPLWVDAAAEAGTDVMISGHTHNGQIWPFNYLVKTLYPYVYGKYAIDGMTLFVSRGAGAWGPRMRLWSAGEIVRITLKRCH